MDANLGHSNGHINEEKTTVKLGNLYGKKDSGVYVIGRLIK